VAVSRAGPRALLVAVHALARDQLPGRLRERDREAVGALLSALARWRESPSPDTWNQVTTARELAWPDLGVKVLESPGGPIPLLQAPGTPAPGGPDFVPYEEALALALLLTGNEEAVALERLAMLLGEVINHLGVGRFLGRLKEEFVPWLLSPDPRASSRGA